MDGQQVVLRSRAAHDALVHMENENPDDPHPVFKGGQDHNEHVCDVMVALALFKIGLRREQVRRKYQQPSRHVAVF